MVDFYLATFNGDPVQGYDTFDLLPSGLSSAGTTPTSLPALVHVSLHTDRRAEEGDLPERVERRGWWADTFEPEPLGSRLWLLEHKGASPETVAAAKDYATEALAWMVDAELCHDVNVQVSSPSRERVDLHVELLRHDGQPLHYAHLWEELNP